MLWNQYRISKLLQITHAQWIFRNISLYDKTQGYLRNKKADEILQLINEFADVPPEEIPNDSRFLLEINFTDLAKSHLETQTYWILAMEAAIKAKSLELARGARAKRIRRRLNTKIAGRTKLGITAVKQQIQRDGMHRPSATPCEISADSRLQPTLERFIKRRPHPASTMGTMKLNKRLRKPD